MTNCKFRNGVRRALALGVAALIVAGASSISNLGMAQTTVASTSASVIDARKKPPGAPEANTGMVLMPLLLAVLLLSSRRLLRRPVAQKP
jgi:hypothetical protein